MEFDLLIIFSDGTEHLVKNVSDYEFIFKTQCFTYTKNGYKAYLPMNQVKFLGRAFDFHNLS